jgi:hypothetical protein
MFDFLPMTQKSRSGRPERLFYLRAAVNRLAAAS